MNIQATIESLIRMMRRKLELAGRAPGAFEELEWNRVLGRAKARKDLPAAQKMVSAWELQLQRETGELHLSQEAMQRMWQQAIEAGETCLADLTANGDVPQAKAVKSPVEQAATAVKRRLKGYADAAKALPEDASHAQVLTAMARADGFSNLQALTAVLVHAPAFCPQCGTPGSVQSSYDGYGCSRCHIAFSFGVVSPVATELPAERVKRLQREALAAAGYRVQRYNGAVRSQRYIWKTDSEMGGVGPTEGDTYSWAWLHARDQVCEREGISTEAWDAFALETQALLVSTLKDEQLV
jgi:hypothetical protein